MKTSTGFAFARRYSTSSGPVSLKQSVSYKVPPWAAPHFLSPPERKLSLTTLPTPLYPVDGRGPILDKLASLDISLFIKRDDWTGGIELGGSKLRKLEFLLAEALDMECDAVVAVGAEQSNCCRATACAVRALGLEPHLVIETDRANAVHGNQEGCDVAGNFLMMRMVGSYIYLCTSEEYDRVGSDTLVEHLCNQLEAEGKRTYGIPYGGSNRVGNWGYLEAVDELGRQCEGISFDHVVFACRSGGTATGIALGMALHPTMSAKVHAVGVSDDPDYFYDVVKDLADKMEFQHDHEETLGFVKSHLTMHQGKGLGYGKCTKKELEFCHQFAQETGVVLDPVYNGKAFYHWVRHVLDESYRGSRILLWHTGGALNVQQQPIPFSSSKMKGLDLLSVRESGGIPG